MSAEIIAEFKDGQAVVKVNGVKGKACKDLTAKIEAALGVVTKDEDTSEMHEKPIKSAQRVKQ